MKTVIAYSKLSEYISERPPLLMVDRLEIGADGRSARGVKAVSIGEMYFIGHFGPGAEIMPGVLQVAAMAQVGEALLRRPGSGREGRVARVRAISRVKFRKPVLPGALLTVEAEHKGTTADGLEQITAKTLVGDAVACQGNIDLEFVDRNDPMATASELAPPIRMPTDIGSDHGMDVEAVMRKIPHRFPFLLVDKVLALDVQVDTQSGRAVTLKSVTGNEPFFAGTAVPVMPLYLLAEASAQAACVIALTLPENESKLGYFMSIDHARSLTPIVPGDQLVIDATLTGRGGRFGIAEAKLMVGDRLVAETSLKFVIVGHNEKVE